jgi:HSP20 family molecular chaperone IbpA
MLVRRKPARESMDMWNGMNRLAHEFFRSSDAEGEGWWRGSWRPAVDMHESAQAIVLKAELPGILAGGPAG